MEKINPDKIGIIESPKGSGRWQVYFTDPATKKQVHLFKMEDGTPLRTKSQCHVIKFHLIKYGYYPEDFGKDTTYNFNVAAKNWVKLSPTSPEWRKERERLVDKTFIPFFGKTDIRKIPTIKIDQFQQSLMDKGLSSKYVSNVMGELKAFFRFNKKSIPELPEFRKVIVQAKPIKWINEQQQDKIFEHIPNHHKPIFTFLRYYGCRLNEACALRWEDIHREHQPPYFTIVNAIGDNGQLKPTTKTKKIRVLPIIDATVHLFNRERTSSYIFHRNGKPYTSRALGRIWDRACGKAKIKINAYNGLRHSWATQRLNMGFGLDKIQTVLGHTSPEMTHRYAEYAVENLCEVIRGNISGKAILIENNEVKLLELKTKLVGGTGIEPVTSGL
jgi:integrase